MYLDQWQKFSVVQYVFIILGIPILVYGVYLLSLPKEEIVVDNGITSPHLSPNPITPIIVTSIDNPTRRRDSKASFKSLKDTTNDIMNDKISHDSEFMRKNKKMDDNPPDYSSKIDIRSNSKRNSVTDYNEQVT